LRSCGSLEAADLAVARAVVDEGDELAAIAVLAIERLLRRSARRSRSARSYESRRSFWAASIAAQQTSLEPW
jgi:hypothetical protein